jgi:hypothetical protein
MSDCVESGDGTCAMCNQKMPGVGVRRNCMALAKARPVGPRIQFPRIAVGDVVEGVLLKFGVTKERVQRITRRSNCRCEFRKNWLNNAGYKCQFYAERLVNQLADFFFW